MVELLFLGMMVVLIAWDVVPRLYAMHLLAEIAKEKARALQKDHIDTSDECAARASKEP